MGLVVIAAIERGACRGAAGLQSYPFNRPAKANNAAERFGRQTSLLQKQAPQVPGADSGFISNGRRRNATAAETQPPDVTIDAITRWIAESPSGICKKLSSDVMRSASDSASPSRSESERDRLLHSASRSTRSSVNR